MNRQRPITSRLAKREQKKLARQTMLITGTTIVLVLLFIFFVLPNVVRVAFNVLDGDTIGQQSDTIPPQIPIISAPVAATNSATIKINGFGEAKSKVILVHNNEEVDERIISDEGEFEFELTLDEGENSVSAFSVDVSENESLSSKQYTIVYDNQDPTIDITSHEDGSTVTLRRNKLTTITGTTEPRAKVFVDGRLNLADSEGKFSGTYNLAEGENKIKIVAQDEAGNTTEMELTLHFQF